ncbi:hypothetical protein SSX86_026035 [Deinandra increscens subsp. villosa]|uniref:Uncharacterized protein n=1 Tax=Deinandra increscens subsp. villosa TaxID=3103831 RepID=A0AAP0CE56_9ASTR
MSRNRTKNCANSFSTRMMVITTEDDDLNEDWPEDHISLGYPAEKKGEVQILSQLDMLRDANEVIHERNQSSLPLKRHTDTCVEDDVELPIFANMDESTCNSGKASAFNSDGEIISKTKVTGNCVPLSKCFTSEADNYHKINPFSSGGNRKGVCTWLAENAEADALTTVNDNSDCASFHSSASNVKRPSKGGQGKAKHKFSIRKQSHNDSLFKDSSHAYESHTSIKGKEMDGMTKYVMPAGYSVSHTHSTTSMAELLLQVQDEHGLPEGSTMNVAFYNKAEGQSKERAVKESMLSPGHSDIDDDPDCLDSESSEENEYNHQIQELIMPESKQKTIADQFHEALGAASTNEDGPMYAVPQHTGFGLFRKLQRVMQSEKEKDSIFLNKLQKEDDVSCLDVKILSKTLEGKLTVCLCSSTENDESSTSTDGPQNIIKRKTMTIIFSSRICSDVELDVGTLIRVHPPWKEVNLKGSDKSAILSTYFSQV